MSSQDQEDSTHFVLENEKLSKSTHFEEEGLIILAPPLLSSPKGVEILTNQIEDDDCCFSEEIIQAPEFRIKAQAFLLTYNKADEPFFNEDDLKALRIQLQDSGSPNELSGCLEIGKAGNVHMHMMFSGKTDRLLNGFSYKGILPNVSINRARGHGKKASVMRGHYYCGIAPKIGQLTGFSTLVEKEKFDLMQAMWVMSLVRQGKMTPQNGILELWKWRNNETYQLKKLESLVCKMDVELVKVRQDTVIEKATSRMRPWKNIRIIDGWRLQYVDPSEFRYDFLVLIGPSKSGKSKFAEGLFTNPFNHYNVECWMGYDSLIHDGIIYHDVPNIFNVILQKRDFFQANGSKMVDTSATNCYAKSVDLLAKPIVIVTNRDNYGGDNENAWINSNSVKYTVGENEVLWELEDMDVTHSESVDDLSVFSDW